MTLSPDTLRRVRHIELQTRKLVDDMFAGAYHAVFKGRGIEFDTVRPYEPGDDIRSIDWNITARAGTPYIKQYVEERELTVMLLLDVSGSSFFGTRRQLKHHQAVEMGALLALSAIRNNDKVGLLLFSDHIERYVPPRKGRNHTLRLIRDLLEFQPEHKETDIYLALHSINRILKRQAIIFLISDFLSSKNAYEHELSLAARRHDVIAAVLSDPLEQIWPDVGLITIRDSETGNTHWIDTNDAHWRTLFEQQSRHLRDQRNTALTRAGVERLDLTANSDSSAVLAHFFQQRMKRTRR